MLLAESTRLLSLFTFFLLTIKNEFIYTDFSWFYEEKVLFLSFLGISKRTLLRYSQTLISINDLEFQLFQLLIAKTEVYTISPSLAEYAFWFSLENEGGVHAPKAFINNKG